MLDKVYNFIKEQNMLKQGDTVVCGLSGGADSVALLLLLDELKEKLGIRLEALHVNHCIRGEESDRDERFCCELCSRLGITFHSEKCDVTGTARKIGRSTEETARMLRYDIFSAYSKGKKLATAHNANDNLETALLNLARGSGLKGIAGIPCIRGNIIRPILTVTRDEIVSFLKYRGQSHVTDSTNLSDDYTRNRIRHRIIPLMQEINGSVIETSVNTLSALREENSLIEFLTDEACSKCRSGSSFAGLTEYPPVIRKRCIARLLSENNIPYSFKRLEEADELLLRNGKLNVSDDLFLIAKNGKIRLSSIKSQEEISYYGSLEMGVKKLYDGCSVYCERVECDNLKKIEAVHKNSTFYIMDYDKIRGKLIVRTRIYGDKIKLKGRNFTSSVKKLINEKIPSEKRNGLLFLEDEEGTVLAEEIGIADRTAPDENTSAFLVISFIRS